MKLWAVTIRSTDELFIVGSNHGVRGAIRRATFQSELKNDFPFSVKRARFSVRKATLRESQFFNHYFPNTDYDLT